MQVGQRSGRAPNAASSSSPGQAMDALGRGGSSAGMAGIGAGRSGAAASYRSYASSDHRSYHDQNAAPPHWNAFDSAQHADPSQYYASLPSAHSTSSFDVQSRTFDAMSLPSSSSLYTSQSMHNLPESSYDSAAASSSSAATHSSPTSSAHQRAISEVELLAFVDQKRSHPAKQDAGKHSNQSSTSEIKSNKDSSNPLDTLDLCHKRIDRVPDALVVMIKDHVVRLALGYNHLTRLPDNFADLRSLRYLNIRANNFAHFPECVTQMPNLEILDLSRNKVRTLPQVPGRLLSLRVLSMNANRLTELPSWIGKMKHLRILKLDNNPLQWPPPHISKMPNVAPPKPPSSSTSSPAAEREKVKRFEDRQMLVWIAKLRSWINDPANQTQNLAISSAEQPSTTSAEPEAAKASGTQNDLAGHPDSGAIELPASHSDGLMSLQVQVPKSISDRTLVPDAVDGASASQTPMESASGAPTGSAPAHADAVANGLLPSLVPESSANGELANVEALPSDAYASSSMVEYVTPTQPTQQRSQSSHASSNSDTNQDFGAIDAHTTQTILNDAEARQHARNNSHSVAQDIAATPQIESRRSLKSKKSLPDLRKSHKDILQERRDVLADLQSEKKAQQPHVSHRYDPSVDRVQTLASSSSTPLATGADALLPQTQSLAAQSSSRKPSLQARRAPRPSLGNGLAPSSRQGYEGATATHLAPQAGAGPGQGGGLRKLSLPTVGATQAAAEAAAAALAARAGYSNTPPRFDVGHGRMASDRGGDNNWPARSGSPSINNSRTAADQERNSYFRRLSTLPPSTISKAVPVPVLKFVDGTRGVLFALSQIHAAIGQFMTPVIDERISSQFHRLLDISNGSVANLINALDRFDSLSRRGSPDPCVIRGVLVTCKDSVITFRKLVSVLQLQLRALQSSSDVRYARTLLLMLYGSMAEVSNSWAEMAPLVEAVQPYLTEADTGNSSPASSEAATPTSEKATPPLTRAGTLLQKSVSNNSNGSTPTLPSIAEATTPVRAGARPYIARGPSRRRHAGSFSAQDLAQGAAMTPSSSNQPPFNLEDLQATSAYNTPARGARSRRQGSWGNSASSAATFAQSDASDRSATVDATQSTAPSTPGGGAMTASAQRAIYATPGAMSTPTSSRQKRSGSNASSAMEGGAPGSSAVTPRSQATTPATPAAGNAKRGLHVATPSTGNAAAAAATANGTAAAGPAAAGSRLRMAVSDPKITVDDHLLEMVDNITKLSARVWSMLFEHLRSAGVDEQQPSSSSETSPVEDRQGAAETADDAPATHSDSDKDGLPDQPAPAVRIVIDENSESAKKLRELRDLAQITDELTSQLRSTYLRAREEEQGRSTIDADPASADDDNPAEPVEVIAASTDNISQPTATKLFDESHRFVRAIVNTSTLMKAISVGHEFPRDLRRMLGQVAQACSNLTVYLLWLSPTVS